MLPKKIESDLIQTEPRNSHSTTAETLALAYSTGQTQCK